MFKRKSTERNAYTNTNWQATEHLGCAQFCYCILIANSVRRAIVILIFRGGRAAFRGRGTHFHTQKAPTPYS